MSLFAELKRRNVFKVGIAYVVAAWLLLQLTEVLSELLELNTDIGKIVVILLVVGFIPALIFAWAFELTPDGIKREADVDRSQSVTQKTGRKLDLAVIGMLTLIAGYFIWEARFKAPSAIAPPTATAEADTPAAPIEPAEAELQSIAVLPFANRSNQSDDLFFTDGIHDDLLTQLAKIEDLKVISRTSVMEYRGTTKKIPEIARELGVTRILEGGVQRAGSRVRINAQLIDVATDEHLWAETFDREMTIENIFDIQSEITRRIVNAVRGEMTEEERRSLDARPTDSLEAWEAYLHARSIISEPDYSAEKYLSARPWVERAVAADPRFAEAWALLSEIRTQGIWIGYANTDEQRALVEQALERAVSLDPANAMVLTAQSDYEYRVNLDYRKALALQEEAIALRPGDADLRQARGIILRRLGRWEEAVEAFEKALELDPLNGFSAATMTETMLLMNDFERLARTLERWRPREPESLYFTSHAVALLIDRHGDLDGARRVLNELPGKPGVAGPAIWLNYATLARDWDLAIEILENMPDDHIALDVFARTRDFELGRIYSLRGDQETAKGYMEAFVERHPPGAAGSRVANAFRFARLAEAHYQLGNPDLAVSYAERAAELLPRETDQLFGAWISRDETLALARAGQRDLALERLAGQLDEPMGLTRWHLYLDPNWDFFRDDARFNELVRPEGVEPDPLRAQRLGGGT